MRKIIPFIMVTAMVTTAAQAAEVRRIQRDGYNIEYSVKQLSDGTRRYSGYNYNEGYSFTLRLDGRKLSGWVGGKRIQQILPAEGSATVLASK